MASSSFVSACLLLISIASISNIASASNPTAPAFIWSEHRSSGLEIHGAVDYRIFTPKTLIETITQKLGWSTSLCGSDKKNVETVVAYIGNQLRSEDLSLDVDDDNLSVRKLLRDVFSSANYSVALPYVSIPSRGPGIASMLVSTVKNSCGQKSRSGKMIVMGPCIRQMANSNFLKLAEGLQLAESIEDIKEFIHTRKASRVNSESDIIMACSQSRVEAGETESEGSTLATILSSLRQSGTSNVVLYASDPALKNHYDFHGRSLVSNSSSTCDDICETITGVYEGIIVAVTLLIILISGLCCMMGIDTPSRFESPQES